jgi:signal transduction histidine kinase
VKSLVHFVLLPICLFLLQPAVAQKDSTRLLGEALKECNTKAEGEAVNARIEHFVKQYSDKDLTANTNYFLSEAAKASLAKDIFHQLFYFFEGEYQQRNLEKEFNLLALKLEDDPDFAAHDVKYQLYYYYATFYYHLKEYYYAGKYTQLFLNDGSTTLPENIQANSELNAYTILALINRNTGNLDTATQQFKAILELSQVKKNTAWEGITAGNLAYSLFLANRFLEAIPYYKNDERLSVETNETASALRARISLGEVYLKLCQPDSALTYINSASQLLDSMRATGKFVQGDYLEDQQELFTFFGNYYHQTGDFKKSSDYFSNASLLQDSVQREEKTKRLQHLVENMEVDKNINALNELHNNIKDKRFYLFLIGTVVIAGVCILMLLSFFVVRLLARNKKLTKQNDIIKRQRTQLKKINAENYKLFSIISHDVKGPAASVNRLLQLLGRKLVSAEDFEKMLPGMLTNSANLNSTIESLLNWSTAQFNGIETHPETVEIKAAIDKIIPLFLEQAQEKSVVIENDCVPQPVWVDKHQFEIIVRNATANAIKFSHPNSVIRFTVQDTGTHVALTLTDAGVGMTEEQIDHIINKPSFKTTTGTTGEKGVGLGLKLVKEFVEKNAGTFKIESTIGVGTNLTFTIPKAG